MTFIYGCNVKQKSSTPPSTSGFALYLVSLSKPINANDWQRRSYEESPGWQKLLKDGKLGEILITDQDITSYDWDNQIITLTKDASQRFKEKTKKDSVHMEPFIVTLNGERLYAGRVLMEYSAVGGDFPALYLSLHT